MPNFDLSSVIAEPVYLGSSSSGIKVITLCSDGVTKKISIPNYAIEESIAGSTAAQYNGARIRPICATPSAVPFVTEANFPRLNSGSLKQWFPPQASPQPPNVASSHGRRTSIQHLYAMADQVIAPNTRGFNPMNPATKFPPRCFGVQYATDPFRLQNSAKIPTQSTQHLLQYRALCAGNHMAAAGYPCGNNIIHPHPPSSSPYYRRHHQPCGIPSTTHAQLIPPPVDPTGCWFPPHYYPQYDIATRYQLTQPPVSWTDPSAWPCHNQAPVSLPTPQTFAQKPTSALLTKRATHEAPPLLSSVHADHPVCWPSAGLSSSDLSTAAAFLSLLEKDTDLSVSDCSADSPRLPVASLHQNFEPCCQDEISTLASHSIPVSATDTQSHAVIQQSERNIEPSHAVIQPLEGDTESSYAVIQLPERDAESLHAVIQPPSGDTESSHAVLQPSGDNESSCVVLQPSEGDTESSHAVIQQSERDTESSHAVLQPSEGDTESSHAVIQPSKGDTESSHAVLQLSEEDTGSSHAVFHPSEGDTESPLPVFQLSGDTESSHAVVFGPSNGDTESPHAVLQPLVGDTESSHAAIQPSERDTESSHAVIQPSEGDPESAHAVFQPSLGDTVSSHAALQPSEGDTESSHAGIQPSKGDTESSHAVLQLSEEDTESSHAVLQPSDGDTESSLPVFQPSRDTESSHAVVFGNFGPSNGDTESPHAVSQPLVGDSESSHAAIQPSERDTESSHAVIQPSEEDPESAHAVFQPSLGDTVSSHAVLQQSVGDTESSHSVLQTSGDTESSHSVLQTSGDTESSHAVLHPSRDTDSLHAILEPPNIDSSPAVVFESVSFDSSEANASSFTKPSASLDSMDKRVLSASSQSSSNYLPTDIVPSSITCSVRCRAIGQSEHVLLQKFNIHKFADVNLGKRISLHRKDCVTREDPLGKSYVISDRKTSDMLEGFEGALGMTRQSGRKRKPEQDVLKLEHAVIQPSAGDIESSHAVVFRPSNGDTESSHAVLQLSEGDTESSHAVIQQSAGDTESLHSVLQTSRDTESLHAVLHPSGNTDSLHAILEPSNLDSSPAVVFESVSFDSSEANASSFTKPSASLGSMDKRVLSASSQSSSNDLPTDIVPSSITCSVRCRAVGQSEHVLLQKFNIHKFANVNLGKRISVHRKDCVTREDPLGKSYVISDRKTSDVLDGFEGALGRTRQSGRKRKPEQDVLKLEHQVKRRNLKSKSEFKVSSDRKLKHRKRKRQY